MVTLTGIYTCAVLLLMLFVVGSLCLWTPFLDILDLSLNFDLFP